jgi:hypothetical protein
VVPEVTGRWGDPGPGQLVGGADRLLLQDLLDLLRLVVAALAVEAVDPVDHGPGLDGFLLADAEFFGDCPPGPVSP